MSGATLTGSENSQPWLVISYFANEEGLACSHHIDDRLPILKEYGVEVTLLTSCCVRKLSYIRHLRACSLAPSGIRFELRHVLKRAKMPRSLSKLFEILILFPVYPFYLIEKLLVNLDTTWYWTSLASIRGLLACLRYKPVVIYSTGGAISAHLVAFLAARLFEIRWIAEFQDPLIHSYCARSKGEYKLVAWAERLICSNADRVVFLTGAALEQACRRTSLDRRGKVIFPGSGVPESNENKYSRSSKFNLVHIGSLGGSRNLIALTTALKEVLLDHPELRDIIRVVLLGSLGRDIHEQVNAFPYPEMFDIRGMVSRHQALTEMFAADQLLLVQNQDPISSETIPSKVYEYLNSGRPILGLIYNNNELSTMLTGLGHLSADITDHVSVSAGILEALAYWQRSDSGHNYQASPYTTNAAVCQLIQLAKA